MALKKRQVGRTAVRGTLEDLRAELHAIAKPSYAAVAQRFFKTAKGEYGEGDIFIGIRVPVLREHAKRYRHVKLADMRRLLRSPIHEERLVALFLMVDAYRYSRSSEERERIVQAYLASTRYINNWDLVDTSAHKILGRHYAFGSAAHLYRLAKSSSVWERRIAIIATLWFIGQKRYEPTLKIAEMLLHDDHDLIHKAVGWMLREVGKRSLETEAAFLDEYAARMPRTMLRYAIERLPKPQQRTYLHMRSQSFADHEIRFRQKKT